jgi:hypothetical protein
MTKASLISYVVARWGDITAPKRTPIKDREVVNSVIDEIYPSIVSEAYTLLGSTVTNTVPIGTTHYYQTYWKKQGGVVHVEGTITNKTGGSVSNEDWITISNADYLAKATVKRFFGFTNGSLRIIEMQIIGNKIKVISPVFINETVVFETSYLTQN